jgi:hypothetical protein
MGALPPNLTKKRQQSLESEVSIVNTSRTTGFRYFAQMEAIIRPTGVDPVKFTRRTVSCLIMVSVTVAAASRGQHMKLRTPEGRPAFLNESTSKYCVYGLLSEAFSTTVFPQTSGVIKALIPRI